MKVKELIELLQQEDGDRRIFIKRPSGRLLQPAEIQKVACSSGGGTTIPCLALCGYKTDFGIDP